MEETNITLEKIVADIRSDIEQLAARVLSVKKEAGSPTTSLPIGEKEDRGEVIANVTLAYRHLEDAKMRLGKVFQAVNGGVSNNSR